MSRPCPEKDPSVKDKLTCIDANQGEKVYEYFNGVLGDDAARQFEEHLLVCFRCQDVVLNLDAVFNLLAEKKDLFFSKPGMEASKALCRQAMNSKRARRSRA